MARMKDIKIKCENKFNILKERLRIDKPGDQSLKLAYDTSHTMFNISVTKEFCSEMKRIGSYGLVTYSIDDDEKKLKKKSLNTLAGLFSETSSKFSEIDPKRGPLNYSALALVEIMQFTKSFRKNLQLNVMDPLEELEKTCIEIQELDKRIHGLKRDIASLIDKQVRFEDQANQDEQKSQAIKDQIINAQTEFDNSTDLYLQKILTFEASNFRHAEALQDMILLRTEYHERCAKTLLKIIPQCNTYMEDKRIPLSFGTPLENHLRETKRFIAYPIEFCVKALSDISNLQQEGLFRVSGSISKANLLCTVLNLMKCDQIDIEWPPHVWADALKRYLREMPVSLLGKISYTEWESCYEKYKTGNKQVAYRKIKDLLGKLPKSYYQNLEFLIRFLNQVIYEKSYNLMGIQNICTVFVPNLFKSQSVDSSSLSGMNMDNNTYFNFILESLLQDTNFFFPHSDQIARKSSINKEIERSINAKAITPNSLNENNLMANSVKEQVFNFSRSNSVVDRYIEVFSANNNDRKSDTSLSRSQRRRQQLEVNPVNFEELEDRLNNKSPSVSVHLEESIPIVPPVPPRSKSRKE